MRTFKQYIAEQAPMQPIQQQTQPVKPGQPVQQTQPVKPGQPVQQTQPVKPGQKPQPNVDVKKLTDTFNALKGLLAPFGIK
jgi:hypothetical protein